MCVPYDINYQLTIITVKEGRSGRKQSRTQRRNIPKILFK